jgi:DNA-binding NarL/FixJ family response regulator
VNEGETIRVVIVDDHALFRRGLDLVLSEEPDIKVVGEAADGIEAVHRAEEMGPDVVVMDVRMPRSTGIEAARRIRERLPDTKVIMLTVSDSEEDLYAAVKAGASGYLLKEISIEELADAVRAVARGHSLISPSMASKLLTEFNALVQQAEDRHRSLLPSLTDRELDVLKLVAKGLSNREISEELYISENTVKNHVRNILEKLHLHSRMEAVVYAMREKLLDVD